MRTQIRACLIALLLVAAIPATVAQAADTQPEAGMIVFSSRHWEGDYSTDNGGPPTPYTSAVYVVPADGSAEPRQVVQVGDRADYPAYSPDKQWLYFQAPEDGHFQIFRCHEDGSEVQDLTKGHQPPGDRYGRSIARYSAKIVYTYHNGEIGRVAIMNADGSDEKLIAPDIGYHYMAELSPDGKSVAFAHTAKGYVLALKHLDTGELVTLTPDLPESYCPQFTPDGKTLIFFRRNGAVYRIDIDGTNLKQLTDGSKYVEFRLAPTDKHGSSDPPVLSKDGKLIAYTAVVNDVPQIHVMNLDGSGQRQVTFRPGPCGRPRFSPDGTRLAFVSWEGKYPQLFVIPLAGGEAKQITHFDSAVYFLEWKPE
ncbi:MAG: hypothetical protein WCP21_02715 [Armatimonadota bacterium]